MGRMKRKPEIMSEAPTSLASITGVSGNGRKAADSQVLRDNCSTDLRPPEMSMMNGCGNKIGPYDCCSIIVGDCLDVMAEMPDQCIDMVITDPLFTLPVATAASRKRIRNLGDFSASSCQMSLVFDSLERITKSSSRMFVFCDAVFYPVLYVICYGRWDCQLLVWDKKRFGFGRDFRKRFELILYLRGAEAPPLRRPNNRPDILQCSPVPSKERLVEAQKPTGLIHDLIFGVPGNVIFDPFAGSGTSLVVARDACRHFFGCDINPEYVAIAEKRLSTGQLRLA